MSLTTLCDTQMPNWRGLLDLEPIDKFLYDPASSILLNLKTDLLEAWSDKHSSESCLLTKTDFCGERQAFWRPLTSKIGLFSVSFDDFGKFWWQCLGDNFWVTTIVCSVERQSFWILEQRAGLFLWRPFEVSWRRWRAIWVILSCREFPTPC